MGNLVAVPRGRCEPLAVAGDTFKVLQVRSLSTRRLSPRLLLSVPWLHLRPV